MKKILLIGALAISACTTNPQTGETSMSNTAKGAGIGAAVGAGAGTLFGGNDLENAGFGALAGGAVGAAIGAYMDSQEQEMQETLQGTGIEVKRSAKNKLKLTMPSNVTFGFDSAELTPQASHALDSVAKVLNRYPESTINIAGYTDDTGSDSYNQKLSEQRALSVSSYLSQHGIEYNRLSTQGYGESNPKVPNTSEENRAQNRRVELSITAHNNAGQGGRQKHKQRRQQGSYQ